MKSQAVFFAVFLVIAGCTGSEVKKEDSVADKVKMTAGYLATAQQQESKGELVEALENYKLALTVDPENQIAQGKRSEIEKKLSDLAEENYKAGLDLQRMGRYSQARQKFLTAVRYKPDYPEAVEMLKADRLDSQRVRLYFLYVIKPAEQLSHVAERYYRDYQKHYLIGAYNEVDDATKITAGQTIKVPVIEGLTCFVTPDEAAALSKQRSGPLPPEVMVVKGYATHTTRPGDTLAKLSEQYYGVKDKGDLIAKYNNLKETAGFKTGRKLLVPQLPGAPFLGSVSTETPTPEVPKGPPAEIKEPAPEMKPEPAKPAPAPVAVPAAPVNQVGGYRQQGIEFHKHQNYPAAIAEFKKVLNVEPKDPVSLQYISQAHFELGVKSFEQKSYLQAVENFKSSLAYNRSCDKCSDYIRKSEDSFKEEHYNKGLTSFQNEKLTDAIREWELVNALDPAYKDVSRNLQKARTLQERLDTITRSKPQ
ncbi:MAG: LysM peptidoglycan-binding domain-containing protein [Deltaproteobacteria bacterium]|nr:LysM peptidoglycan-binding domain-containing protein [Deltaproteobacteria bacterium]